MTPSFESEREMPARRYSLAQPSDTSARQSVTAARSKGVPIDPDAIQLAASYVIVHNFLAHVRNATERRKSSDNLWQADRVAGTQEQSEVGVPYEILDRVFARLAGIMQSLGETISDIPGECSYSSWLVLSTQRFAKRLLFFF